MPDCRSVAEHAVSMQQQVDTLLKLALSFPKHALAVTLEERMRGAEAAAHGQQGERCQPVPPRELVSTLQTETQEVASLLQSCHLPCKGCVALPPENLGTTPGANAVSPRSLKPKAHTWAAKSLGAGPANHCERPVAAVRWPPPEAGHSSDSCCHAFSKQAQISNPASAFHPSKAMIPCDATYRDISTHPLSYTHRGVRRGAPTIAWGLEQ
mmetsp:Transcript_94556/g.276326  ORF Transcript_94556/g.276326 Transcript_94556/m.276326 type:complete len:211 (-) Transcript_94556:4-636(-)